MLTVSEFAAEVGLHPQTIKDAIAMGMIEARKEMHHGRSGIREMHLIDESQVAVYREKRLGQIGSRWGGRNAEEVKEMRERDYLTSMEAAKEIGIQANYLIRLVRAGKIAGERKAQVWIPRTEVARLKRERERKMAAVR